MPLDTLTTAGAPPEPPLFAAPAMDPVTRYRVAQARFLRALAERKRPGSAGISDEYRAAEKALAEAQDARAAALPTGHPCARTSAAGTARADRETPVVSVDRACTVSRRFPPGKSSVSHLTDCGHCGAAPAPRGDVPYHTDGGFGLPVVFTTAGGARDFARSRFTVDQATGDRMPIREAYDVTPILRGELLAARDGAPFLLDGRPVKGGGGEDDD